MLVLVGPNNLRIPVALCPPPPQPPPTQNGRMLGAEGRLDSRFLAGPPLNYAHCQHQQPRPRPVSTRRRSSGGSSGASEKSSGNTRYKTELCRPYAETGSCKYAEKCQFAHGATELRSVPRHPKYKTEKCKTFHSTGFCPYGPRCHFIHHPEDATTTPPAPIAGPPNLSSHHPLILSLARQQAHQLSVHPSSSGDSASTGSTSPSSFSSDDSALDPWPITNRSSLLFAATSPPPTLSKTIPSPASPKVPTTITPNLSSVDVLAAGVENLFGPPTAPQPKRLPVFSRLSSAAA